MDTRGVSGHPGGTLAGPTPVEKNLGRHTVGFEPPALLRFVARGEILPEEIEKFAAFAEEQTRGQPFVLTLTDLTELGAISVATRKTAMRATANIPYRGMAYFGGSFQARLLTKLALRALQLVLRGTDNPMRFFDAEDDARVWLAERARTLSARPNGRSGPSGHAR